MAVRQCGLNLPYDLKSVQESTADLNAYFQEKKIFLPEPLLLSINSLLENIFRVEFVLANVSVVLGPTTEEQRSAEIEGALDNVHKRIPEIMNEIETEIRSILDVNPDNLKL